MIRRVLFGLGLLAGVLLGLGYLGHIHPILDAIAIGRRLAIGFLVVCGVGWLLLSGRRWAAAGCVLLVVVSCGAWFASAPSAPGPLRIYSKNLLYTTPVEPALVADIRDAAPDILVLQEISQQTRDVLETLRADFPHQAVCPMQGWNGMAVLSRWPLPDAPRCSDIRSFMSVKVARPNAPFWVVNAHLQQPWPDYQWDHLNQALWAIEGLDGPAVVAGDFNTVPWAAAPALVGKITQTQPVGPQPKTYNLWGVNLPLDQIWAQSGRVERRPFFGSYHAGILGQVWLETTRQN